MQKIALNLDCSQKFSDASQINLRKTSSCASVIAGNTRSYASIAAASWFLRRLLICVSEQTEKERKGGSVSAGHSLIVKASRELKKLLTPILTYINHN